MTRNFAMKSIPGIFGAVAALAVGSPAVAAPQPSAPAVRLQKHNAAVISHAFALWTNTNGTAAVWNLRDSNPAATALLAGPYPGWTAQVIAQGPDGNGRILWTNTDGRAALWNLVDPNPAATASVYGPFPGWSAKALTVGPDNAAHLLWDNTDGRVALWNTTDTNPAATAVVAGPYAGWSGVAIGIGTDNQERLLWDNVSGQAAVWNLSDVNPPATAGLAGPYSGWTAKRLSVGNDNAAHLLWDNVSGQVALWNLSDPNPAASCLVYGPYGGWSGQDLSVGLDGKGRLLWDNVNGLASLWDLVDTDPAATSVLAGPYPGWTAVSLSASTYPGSLSDFDGTYTSSVVINGYTHTETDTVSNGAVTGHHSFTNGTNSGSFDWTGTATLSATDSADANIAGSGTINNVGVRAFTLTSGTIYLNVDGTATLSWAGTDPKFGGIGGTTTRASNTAGTRLSAGSYQGVYVNTSGPYSPDAGTIAFTVSSSGAVSGYDFDYTGDSSTNPFTGTISNTGVLTLNPADNTISGALFQNATTHVFSSSFTETNGTKGVLNVGLAPTASPLAGSYSGTASNTAQTQSLPLTLTISPIGVVAATLGTPVAGDPNSGFTLTGYVDANGNLYLADTSGGVPENLFASLTLSGTSLTGPTHISAADGYSNTGTFSLTKH